MKWYIVNKDKKDKDILRMLDPINLEYLKSAMGPGRDLEKNASARIRNIETFEETLRKFLASNDYQRYKDLVTFHQYNNEDEIEEKRKNLASRLRDRINLERHHLF